MSRLILLCLLSALSGCATMGSQEHQQAFTAENDAFVGKTSDELIKTKGVPTGTATLSDGSKVVEYYTTQIEISGGGFYSFPATTYMTDTNGSRTLVTIDHMRSLPVRSWQKICKIDFLVTANNVVASWKYDGKGCF